MVSSLQEVEYADPSVEPQLLGFFSELRNNTDEKTKMQAAKGLEYYVVAQARERSPENFKKWLNKLLKNHIWQLINSPVTHEKIGGLIAVDGLIEVGYEDATSIIANYYRFGLKTADPQAMRWAAKTLGHLSRINSNITAECVEFDLHRALEWLQGERSESKRHAACLVFKELATNSPTLFYSQVASFVNLIWVALRDVKPIIRESAVEALGACLMLIAKRESRFRLQWYQQLFEESQKGFGKNTPPESVHASLLALTELLPNTGGFLKDRFHEISSTVFRYKGDKDKLIRKTVITLIPRLAAFLPEKFIQTYLDEAVNHLLLLLRHNNERPTTFLALGQLSVVVGVHMKQHLENIVNMIKLGLATKGKVQFVCTEALVCISMLARAVGPALKRYAKDLLDRMFATGLNHTLTDALADLALHIPDLAPQIQERLLNLISTILAHKPYYPPGTPLKHRRIGAGDASTQQIIVSREDQEKLTALALSTLGSFNFSDHSLTEFLRENVLTHLRDTNFQIRKHAAECCCRLMSKSSEFISHGHLSMIVSEALEELLIVGIADPDCSIRNIVLSSLDSRFDHHLAQAPNLKSLYSALNDEYFDIRELALKIICRLSLLNPAHIMPSLRKTLIQLLRDLKFGGDNVTKEESSHLLGLLISSAASLVIPYREPLMQALLPKLTDSDPGVSAGVLSTIGRLSTVCGYGMKEYLHSLLPLIVETLQDQSSSAKREIAIRTLGQLAESTGYVIKPFDEYPKLLDTILNIIQTETSKSIRTEVLKVFGILGALDPYRQKLNQMALEGRQEEEEGTGKTQKSGDSVVESGLSPSFEDYYPTITIAALMRILRDSSLSQYHTLVINALMFVVKNLGLKNIQFLPQIMPPYLQVMRTCEPGFRTQLFQQLGQLVARVKQHIREYLSEIFELIHLYWDTPNIVHIIALMEGISLALGDEFKPYIPDSLRKFQLVLHTDSSTNREATLKVLHAFEVFGTSLDEYLHLVVPSVIRVCEQSDVRKKVRIMSLQTLGVLCQRFNISPHASRIVHPLARILDSSHQDVQQEVMKTFCIVARQLGRDYLKFEVIVDKILAKHHLSFPEYDIIVAKLRNNEPLEEESKIGTAEATQAETAGEEESPETNAAPSRKMKLNQSNLRRAWEVSQRSTKEDWVEWLRKLSVELLRESPSPALRSCIALANDYHPLVKELFNAAFVSCWAELTEQYQDELSRNLETALLSPTTPPEILQALLNLAEFMEQDEKPLTIDFRTLGELAQKCRAYAKALHYKESEFRTSPKTTIESLIKINNQLQQPDAALGMLTYAQKHNIELKESWYEELHRWRQALSAYEKKSSEDLDAVMGRMRCLNALGEWEQLADLSRNMWQDHPRPQIAALATTAAWNLSNWTDMRSYVNGMDDTAQRGLYRTILAIHQDEFSEAQKWIHHTRDLIDTKLGSLIGESYNRAYKTIVKVQQLSELEEIICYKQQPEQRQALVTIWKERLNGLAPEVDTWKYVLSIRSLVLTPLEDMDSWLKFASLCRKAGRLDLSQQTIGVLLQLDNAAPLSSSYPAISYAHIKQMWSVGQQKEAAQELKKFVTRFHQDDQSLQARMQLRLGKWLIAMENFSEASIPPIIDCFMSAVQCNMDSYKAWHSWALANYEAVSFYERSAPSGGEPPPIEPFLVPAIKGFFRSIALSPNQSLQDTLRLLTLWFKHGARQEAEAALIEGFKEVKIDTWLQVIPQIIARIHAPIINIRKLIQDLMHNIGKEHPQALVYPLTVASKSPQSSRVSAANTVMDKMRKHSARLVDQAQLVSDELIRVSILWHETWHEALEEASRQFFGERNPNAMIATLKPLHLILEKGPETKREVSFQQAYGRDLQEAHEWCKKWERNHQKGDLDKAWDLYYHVFRRIYKQLPQLTMLELKNASPKLLAAQDLELAVPGVYRAGQPIVRIKSFNPNLSVITSKQRPRKLIINGSDGMEYMFLLKGHEDLRQDERVMQLFGLANTLLRSDYETSKNHLNIQRYSVIPLSPNSGLIGWVPQCDTLHQLIRDHRESRKILINLEHRLMLQMAPDYDNLLLMQKVEAFEFALESTNGQDLERILWLKSSNSEVWLERRTNYTRSLAVMSMVGYILGLGDRHPSNLMLDRHTGKVVHIDFGDCFEVAMHREKYPEKIPFRLTRMLTTAMEVSGIEGTYRLTCENVMRVLRQNKESLMAVLEAFVYDPIINWRLLNQTSPDIVSQTPPSTLVKLPSAEAMPEILNRKALQVIHRVNNKLTGRDFGNIEPLSIPDQVQRLIQQATSFENLCQCYIGWCPFW